MRKLMFLIPALAACGNDEGRLDLDASICACDAPGPDGDDGGGGPRELIGTIRLLEERAIYDDAGMPTEQRWATATGYYVVGHMPRWHHLVASGGDCRLLEYTPSLCEPACTDGLCVEADVCEPFTTFQSAGPLTATGLTAPLTMTGPDGYYYAQDPLPAELFGDAATVTATLAGAAYPGHAITTDGVPMIVPAIQTKITLTPGQDHTITWTPAGGDARVRVTLNANNRGHGLPYLAILECDSPDAAGQVTIPAGLVDRFPETQAWTVCVFTDCPPSTIRRYHRGVTAVGGGEAELIVGSQFSFGVDHTP